jgi:uncharacterized protein (TIRG00374 family)
MRAGRAVIAFFLVTAAYVAVLAWADSRNHVFAGLPRLVSMLPMLMGLALLSYLVRYVRWHWLLARAGRRTPWLAGCMAYLSGFAFTATPGKVGELVRIRYLMPLGVEPWMVIAAFVFERAFDLIVVLLLSTLAISDRRLFAFVLAFVGVFIAIVALAVFHPGWFSAISNVLRRHGRPRIAALCDGLRDGLAACRTWMTPLDVAVCVVCGLVAWSITSLAFVWLLGGLGVSIGGLPAFTIYPMAMLAGAASMLPGGVGSTEVTIVALLSLDGVAVGVATLAAIGIRLASFWFSMLCGLAALTTMELRMRPSSSR